MRHLRLLFILALGCVASPAVAAEWWWISSGGDKPDRSLGFIDKESATADSTGKVSAWIFTIHETLQNSGTRKTKALYRFDCDNRTMTLLHLSTYGNNNKFIDSFGVKLYSQEARPVVPDTVGESEWRFVCKGLSEVDSALSISPEEFAAVYFKLKN